MANYQLLKADIDAKVYQNGTQEITGENLNSVLNAMVASLGVGYQFMGMATPINPGTAQNPDYKCFYLATTPGTYTNLGGLVVADGEIAILKYDTSWIKEVTGIAIAESVSQLGQKVIDLEQPVFSVEKSFSTASAGSIPCKFYKGLTYTIYNDGNASVNFSTRETENGSTLDGVFAIAAGSFQIFVAAYDANYLRVNAGTSGRISVKAFQNQIDTINALILDCTKSEDSLAVTTNTTYVYKFLVGETYIISSPNTIVLSTTNSVNGSPVESIGTIEAGQEITFVPTENAQFLRVGFVYNDVTTIKIVRRGKLVEQVDILENKVGILENKFSELNLNRLVFKQGFVNSVDGDDTPSPNYIHTDFIVIDRNTTLVCSSAFSIRGYAKYDNSHIFVGYTFVNGTSCSVEEGIYKFVVRRPQDNTPIVPSEFTLDNSIIKLFPRVDAIASRVDTMTLPPIADFEFDTSLLDVSDELQGINMSAIDDLGCLTFQEQIYQKFDALVSNYPDKIERIDLALSVGVEYPIYANLAGKASGNYLPTPSYKTYMYKVSFPTTLANVGRTANKRSIFVVAGLHGWEAASQLNTYVVASKICECANGDWYSLLSAYDVYFVPCLNGYGAYHDLRVNANGVDLNRNFPFANWAINGEGTDNYSGPSAASEFETQILCKSVQNIKPDIFIDHHSYGATTWTFYVNPSSEIERVLSYKNLYDWNFRACKDYSQYYGDKFEVHPAGFWAGENQSANVWAKNLGIDMSATIEVCLGIGYLNGVTIPLEQAKATYYQAPIVRLNELMLRLALLRFAEYQLRYDKATGTLDESLEV